MFDRILTANHGDIACRIIRAWRRDLPTAAVYRRRKSCRCAHSAVRQRALAHRLTKALESP